MDDRTAYIYWSLDAPCIFHNNTFYAYGLVRNHGTYDLDNVQIKLHRVPNEPMHKRIYTYVEKTMTVIKDDANSVYLMDYPIDEDEKNTHLWESVGALKYALRESITPMRAMSDHNVKKWVFGRKNAHISNLVSAFECKTGIDLHDTFNIKRTKTLRPQIQNIVNCYWLYSYVNHNQKEIGRKVIL